MGINVDTFGPELENYIKSQTDDYHVVVQENSTDIEQLGDDDLVEETVVASSQRSLAINYRSEMHSEAACELFVKDTGKVSSCFQLG